MSAEEQTTEPNQDAKPKRPTRHATIMRGVVTPIFGLLAVASIVLGVLNATIWKPSTEITASASITGSQYIITDPGVLDLLDQNTTLTVESRSSSGQTCVALGPAKDVTGWVGSDAYQRITGLSSWTTLSTERAGSGSGSSDSSSSDSDSSGSSDSSANATAEVAFKDSDLWTSVKCGTGSATLNVKKATGSTVAIVDLGEGNADATVKLNWVRSEVPDFAMPFYLSGGLLAIIAVLCASVFAMPPHKRRNKRVIEGVAHEVVEAGLSFAERAERAASGAVAPSYPASGDAAGRKRRRHASHRRGATPAVSEQSGTDESVAQSPTIIDPASRNLVADQQSAAPAASDQTGASPLPAVNTDAESTSVITPDELQAYFSRLAQEVNNSGDANGDGQEENR
ncbi:hypothetical protein [Bifidobacterium callitrichidarum]|uniref:Asp-tRNAAsn/Glu-tRNAGln amidotransferase A subunit n=1 Tax=Bifidobacterium callitrichidarum TaxID=2052941 RepID=A0A2U2N0Q4_9BIFI|nr:hypothetical protein [Bifidobacterium callitrichidarum]PWG62766.1 hypothetical protein DF196_11740 [Bifidobacterium callitrichidarum]